VWLDEAAEVYGQAIQAGTELAPGEDVTNGRDALEAAGIPCYLDMYEVPPEKPYPYGRHRWRLMVPAKFSMQAVSVVERELTNEEFEAYWKAHLESLSDQELHAMTPEVALCGLFDRVARVLRVYDEEFARRGLKPKSSR
jgi:hypothetical protein